MREMRRRAVAVLLALVMVLTMLPAFSVAAETTPAVTGYTPADGDKVVIYNHSGAACMGTNDGDASDAVASVLADDGTLEPGNGAMIFDVHFDGTYYTFENGGKFLRTSDNKSDGTNEELLFFSDTESDYTKWTLSAVDGGYVIYNKKATYYSGKVCIEFYNESFSGWTYKKDTNELFAMQFFAVEDPHELGYVLNPKIQLVAAEANMDLDYRFTAVLDDSTEIRSMTMRYAVDGGELTTLTADAVEGRTYTYTIPAAAFEGKSSLTLRAAAENEYGMQYAASKTVTILDEPVIVSVTPAANSATGADKRPVISVCVANEGEAPTCDMTVDGAAVTPQTEGKTVHWQSESDMRDGKHTISFKLTRKDGKAVEKTWSFNVGESSMTLYFGQLHSHTGEYSDGIGTLEDAYEHAMAAKDVDFLAVTDHSNYFDTTSTATTTSYYDLSSLSKTADGSKTKWEEARETAARYTTSDFIAIYGYEMTWSGGPGHTNTFNTYGTVSRNNSTINNKSDGYAGMHYYNDLMYYANNGLDENGTPVAEGVQTKYIAEAPVVSQFNHPGTTFGNFDDFAGYTPNRDAVLNLVEVGNGEGQVGGSGYFPSYSEYDLALAKGWHVAPTNNQDNHKGKWGDSNTCRNVILTDNFTEAGIYEALAARRLYSTEDQDLQIYYYLNDQLLGTIIDDGELETVHITASLSDPDGEALGKLEIIGENGLTLYSVSTTASSYELDVELDNTDAYYYLKVTQADGDLAVTAPVWVGLATPITASVASDVALPVVGQTESVTATVTNAAALDYALTRAVVTLNAGGTETVIKTIDTAAVVAAGKSKTFVFDLERTLEGTQVVTITFYGIYNGEQFKCQASMTHKVYAADKLVKIGIDYGHGNFYVSGGYSDNMGNFIALCAENGVSAEYIQQGAFTYEKLKDYAMVILTVPFDSGNLAPSAYTPEELAALTQYAAEGGNLIITTKSDRKSPEGALNCAALTNGLLEAVGSNVRAADGIIVDNTLCSNETYRIYFSSIGNFNTDHRFVQGAYTASNAFGTTPAKENQTGFQLYNAAPILIQEGAQETVTPLVMGYESTWGASYTDNFTGSTYVGSYEEDTVTAAMGEVNIMTYEELSGGGWLIASGCTFFSNYDIKDDQSYANRFIMLNILRELTGADQETITPISEVKVVPEEQSGMEFTIEGYVTSNASDYDADTAFFDCIYIEDKDGNGINVFPVSGNYSIGMHVQCHGAVTYYCGEVELNLGSQYNGSIRVVSDALYDVEPADVTCRTAMDDASIGNLVRVYGQVTDIHYTEGVIDMIDVTDSTGTACVFINGYIMKDYTGLDSLKVGDLVSAVGIGSRDVDQSSDGDGEVFARLRVRNRAEIVVLEALPDPMPSDPADGPCHFARFTDCVAEWYHEAVDFVVANGLFEGVSETAFDPNGKLTRAMLVTVLYRAAGEPEIAQSSSFVDVDAAGWYADAVAWAEANGIVLGVAEKRFAPEQPITREQIATILWRAAGEPKATQTFAAFTDAVRISDYALEAMCWACQEGIFIGDAGRLDPLGHATRAQLALIMLRCMSGSYVCDPAA